MHILKLLLLLITTIHLSWQINNTPIFCSKEFCEAYEAITKCNNIPVACKVQNSTYNGIYLPFPGPCSCCDYCLENLKLNDRCVIGTPGSPPPKTICGDGLQCIDHGKDKDSVCGPIDTPCMKEQQIWDKQQHDGTVGYMRIRPQCDRQGQYQPVKCIPGEICFCVSEEGKRLFGEVSYNPQVQIFMKCGCSRIVNMANKLQKEDKYSLKRVRCMPDGSYDRLQCVGKNCVCVDSDDGYLSDSTIYTNIQLVSSYTLPCFDAKIHAEGRFLRSCEKEFKEVRDVQESYEKNGYEVIALKYPNCQLDGRYASIQENGTDKYCSDPNGNVLENFTINKNDELANTMNCKCARSRSIIENNEKPNCCSNGNYKSVQYRRGLYRCVDGDGMQTGKEVELKDKANLPCSTQECT